MLRVDFNSNVYQERRLLTLFILKCYYMSRGKVTHTYECGTINRKIKKDHLFKFIRKTIQISSRITLLTLYDWYDKHA